MLQYCSLIKKTMQDAVVIADFVLLVLPKRYLPHKSNKLAAEVSNI